MSELKIERADFIAEPGKNVRLQAHATKLPDFYEDEAEYLELLAAIRAEISSLQECMYAHDRYSMLIILQAMDAAGKDGIIEHVFSGINPAGCHVVSFKRPSDEEMSHDFMWRCLKNLPERGKIGIFNRSWYEEALVVRVHPAILNASHLPEALKDGSGKFWDRRLEDIRNIEEYLHRQGTHILKFYLNISRKEQKERLLARMDDPEKWWKVAPQDIVERGHWNSYMEAYEETMEATSTKKSPWYIIPADDKKNARLLVADIVRKHLKDLDIAYPEPGPNFKEELAKARQMLLDQG